MFGWFTKEKSAEECVEDFENAVEIFYITPLEGRPHLKKMTIKECSDYIERNRSVLSRVELNGISLYRNDKVQLNNIDKAIREEGLTKVLQRIVNKDKFIP